MVIDEGMYLDLIEIKSGETFQKDFLKNLKWLNKLQGREKAKCIYGGKKIINLGDFQVIPWNKIGEITNDM